MPWIVIHKIITIIIMMMMDLYGTFRSKDTEDTDTEDTSQLLGNQI